MGHQPNISALSVMQINNFFRQIAPVNQEQCDAMAEEIIGGSVTPTLSQGGSSYTVECGEMVVQFRLPFASMNMDLMKSIEQAYEGFVPRCEYRGRLDKLHVYVMNNVGGICMYLARDKLWDNDYLLLRSTIDDYARFFASAYHNTPPEIILPDRRDLLEKYSSMLQALREGLPERFHPKLDEIIPQLPDLFSEDWPLVPNHTDLLENNIHVDTSTGRIVGICDWANTEIGPFGVSLWGLETMLGYGVMPTWWKYHSNQQEMRDQFWTTFYHHLGGVSDVQKRRIEVARLIGHFLTNGFEYDDNGGRCPAPEGSHYMGLLEAYVLG